MQYGDLSCRNAFFDGYCVKLGDFGASLLAGRAFQPTFCEEAQYELPLRGRALEDPPPIQRDLFAPGSALYEITMSQRPFQGLSDEEVEARYAREAFPSLAGNRAGPLIQQCWDEALDSAGEAAEALARLPAELDTGNDQLHEVERRKSPGNPASSSDPVQNGRTLKRRGRPGGVRPVVTGTPPRFLGIRCSAGPVVVRCVSRSP